MLYLIAVSKLYHRRCLRVATQESQRIKAEILKLSSDMSNRPTEGLPGASTVSCNSAPEILS